MSVITKKEEGIFLLLYNRNGYVLDFTNNTFDVSDADRTKLLVDLFHHYEDEMEYEYNQEYEDFLWSGSSRYDEKYAKIYFKCKEIIDRLDGGTVAIAKTAESLKKIFLASICQSR